MTSTSLAPAPKRIPRRQSALAPAPARARHLRVVDTDAAQLRRRRRWAVRLTALGLAASALIGVVAHSIMAESQLEVIAVERASTVEQRRYEEARLEIARLESPGAVMQRATAMGLVPAGGARTVPVSDAKINATVDAGQVPEATRTWQAIKALLGVTR